jgi:hypothetical protein
MVATVLTDQNERTSMEVLRPEPLADGAEGEQRVVFCGISWKRYQAFDLRLGNDRPSPRLYYLDGELEIMTTSNEHERVKKWIGGFVEDYFLENGIETVPRGQATMSTSSGFIAVSTCPRSGSGAGTNLRFSCWLVPAITNRRRSVPCFPVWTFR